MQDTMTGEKPETEIFLGDANVCFMNDWRYNNSCLPHHSVPSPPRLCLLHAPHQSQAHHSLYFAFSSSHIAPHHVTTYWYILISMPAARTSARRAAAARRGNAAHAGAAAQQGAQLPPGGLDGAPPQQEPGLPAAGAAGPGPGAQAPPAAPQAPAHQLPAQQQPVQQAPSAAASSVRRPGRVTIAALQSQLQEQQQQAQQQQELAAQQLRELQAQLQLPNAGLGNSDEQRQSMDQQPARMITGPQEHPQG